MMKPVTGVNYSFSKHVICGVFLLFLVSCTSTSKNLKPFTTDGCSVFPDGTAEHHSLWTECCIRHDLAYWRGGSFDDRLSADEQLRQCVTKVGEPEVAKLMLAGVRVGGTPYLPTPFRWGYGWPWPRGYTSLTNEEKQPIKQELKNLQIILNSLIHSIKRE